MTRAAATPPLEAPHLDAALDALRAHGLRVSAARRLVLAALYATDEPLSAERIADGLEGRVPPSDIASVYRNLETLEEIGLVRHFHLGHGPGLYVRTGIGVREYLACEACGAVRAVAPAELDEARDAVRTRFGFEARFTHFPVVGTCASCAKGT